MKSCPRCHSESGIREIIYGLPSEPLDDAQYASGGCCISESDPTLICRDCGWKGGYKDNFMGLTQGY